MKISKEQVQTIAKLAKLEFSEKDLQRYQNELSIILEYMEKLNELDTEKIKPVYYVFEHDTPYREDISKKTFKKEEALKNAPQRMDDFFLVPKVKD